MDTIESVQRAVRAWRQEHRRGPLPVPLRRRVGQLAAEVGEAKARQAVGVRAAIVRRWRAEYGASVTKRRNGARAARARFVELRPELARELVPGPSRPGLRIEVGCPGGFAVRIEGARDAAEISAIVRAVVRSGDGS